MDKQQQLKDNLTKLSLDTGAISACAEHMLKQRSLDYCAGVMDTWTNDELKACVQKAPSNDAKNAHSKPFRR